MFERMIKPLRQMSRGGIAGLLAVLVLIGVIGFIAVAREINTAPSQCTTCHPDLTAMWQRSKGHPADKVTCHQCHAPHAELPESLNPAVYLRDRWIPEKYLSADERIEARCRECHPAVSTAGTGPALIAVKEALKRVANRIGEAEWEDRQVRIPETALDRSGGSARGQALLFAAVRDLRDTEWRLASRHAGNGGESGAALEALRQPLEFSTQSLRWARVRRDRIAEGVEKRVSVRISQYRAGLGHVRRGMEQLQALVEPGGAPGLEDAQQKEAEAVLEIMSRGLRSAGRARDALLRELGETEDAVLNPDRLARLLKGVPRGLKEGDLESVRAVLEEGAGLLRSELVDGGWVAEQVQRRVEELTTTLEVRLAGLRSAFEAVLEDLAPAQPLASHSELQWDGAEVVPRRDPGKRAAAEELAARSRSVAPQERVAAALTAIRSLQVSLEAASSLGWSDFSLSDDHIAKLASGFESFSAAFAALYAERPELKAIRNGLETAVAGLARAASEDGVGLAVGVSGVGGGAPSPERWYTGRLAELTRLCVDALFALERSMESRHVIKVNHKLHLALTEDLDARPIQLDCLDCHRNIAHDQAQLETNRPSMAGCFTGSCHRKDRNKDNCQRCHFQQLTENFPETLQQ